MTKTNSEKIECTNCKHSFLVTLYDSINVDHNPELKEQLLNNKLNKAICPKCKKEDKANIPILYNDMQNEIMIWVIPTSGQLFLKKEKKEMIQSFTENLKNSPMGSSELFPNYIFDIVFGIDELSESLEVIKTNNRSEKINTITKNVFGVDIGDDLKELNDNNTEISVEMILEKGFNPKYFPNLHNFSKALEGSEEMENGIKATMERNNVDAKDAVIIMERVLSEEVK